MRVLVWILKRLQDVLIKIWIAQFLALGVAYVVWSDRAEGPYRPTDFAVDLVIAMKQLGVPGLPEIPGLDTLPTGRPAPARAAPPPSLADALPPAPEGWTLRGWQGSDAAVLASAGAALPVEAHGRAVELVLAFEAVMQGATPGLVATYARDADRIVVMIREAPAEPAPAPSSAAPLTVHGVGFEPLGPTADGAGFNALSARIAGTFAVDALANTDMATLAGLLAGLDAARLNRMADTPDPQISPDRGIAFADGFAPDEVTRGTVQPFALDPGLPDTAGAEPVPEPAATGVCVRRAGVLVCE